MCFADTCLSCGQDTGYNKFFSYISSGLSDECQDIPHKELTFVIHCNYLTSSDALRMLQGQISILTAIFLQFLFVLVISMVWRLLKQSTQSIKMSHYAKLLVSLCTLAPSSNTLWFPLWYSIKSALRKSCNSFMTHSWNTL